MSSERPPELGRRQAVSDREIHVAIVRIASIAAAIFLVAVVVSATAAGEPRQLFRALPPLAVSVSGMVMLHTRRVNALVHLIIGMTGLVFIVAIEDGAVPGQPQLGLLAMAITGSLLVQRRIWLYVAALSPLMVYAGYAWHHGAVPAADRFQNAFATTSLFVITAALVAWIQGVSNQRRLRLQKLVRSKDEFVAAVSHELRTPLTTIVGLSTELSERFDQFSRSELEELLGLIRNESQDVAHIVEDLLVVGQDGVGALQLDTRTVLIAEEVLLTAANDGSIQVDVGSHAEVEVLADPGRTRQILRNLVTNARRYGGPEVRMVLRSSADRIAVEVRDTGEPIPMEDRELMFLPYHRARASTGTPGSVGLGLTVSRRLARLMGGDLDYHHDGVESVFTMYLPRRRAADGPALTAVA